MKTIKLQALICVIALACVSILYLPTAYAQDTSGMTGTVTDQSGAALPDATVTLSNSSTGLKATQTTNALGSYRFTNIAPGQGYVATFTAKGFAPFVVRDIYMLVATARTQNAALKVGADISTVEVTAANSEVTLNTTDATVGNDIPVQSLNRLPIQQRDDPTSLFTMQAGVTVDGSVTGARVDQNYITLDGLDVNDFATGGAAQSNSGSGVSSGFEGGIVGHAPVDSVEEFHAGVAGNLANIGAAGGGQFQLITRSGTNQFHGNLNEYHRDEALVANSWFSNNSTPKIPRNHLIQNQFGGNIGGPIKKDKLFFFFDFNDSRILSGILVQRTVPLDSLRNGNISYPNSGGGVSTLTPAQVRTFDPAGLGEDATWVSGFGARFPHSNNNLTGDGVNSGGFNFNAPDNDYETTYVARVDYNLNDAMKMFARFTITREDATIYPNEFAGDPSTDPLVDRSYAFVIGHNWVIGNNKTNRLFLGETVQKLSFPNNYNPLGSTFYTFGDGADQALASSLYLNPNAQARRVPIPMVGDDFTVTRGGHTWQVGGTFKNILAHSTDVADYNTTEIGLGGNTLGLCGPVAGACGTGNPSLRPADVDPTQATLWDEAFTFMLGRIANVQSDYNYTATGSVLPQLTGDQRFYRYYQTQLYAQDSWKVVPGLTFNYGITYQYFSVPYETRGLESTEPLTFDQYFQARLAQSQLGQTGPNAVPLIAYYLGGKGNGAGAPPLFTPEYRNLAPHVGFAWNPGFDRKTVINASAGVVYDRTVINSIQFYQDANSYLFQQTSATAEGIPNDPYNSIKTDPRLDKNNGISNANLVAPATPKPPYQPFSDPAACAAQGLVAPCGLQNGLAFNSTIDPSLKTPYSITYNFGIQRNLPWDLILKASYVGRLGRRLIAQADANQIIDFPDTKSGQMLSQAFGNITTALRKDPNYKHLPTQPWFEDVVTPGLGAALGFANNTQLLGSGGIGGLVSNGDFGDFVQAISTVTPQNVGSAAQFSENTFYGNKGFSTYNGLLLTLTKNLSHGVQVDFNYTFSHSIDNVSFFANSMGDTGIGGIGLVCDVIRPRECRARSDFDVRHYISTDGVYQLPFGKGRMFFATAPFWLNEAIGDWDVSGVASFHTGLPWSSTSNAFVASYSNNAPAIFTGTDRSVISNHVTKLATGGVRDFTDAKAASGSLSGPVGFQIGPRNSFQGPDYFDADMGLGKTFPVYKESVNLKFRADAFNVLNHPSFALPAENVFNGLDQQDYQRGSRFGQISYTVAAPGNHNNGARVLQLAMRMEF